jgi:hypothetical protein
MKKLLLLIFSVSFSLSLSAQWYMYMDFENSADSIITIDTVMMPNNQWQIGTPSKVWMNSGYSQTHSIMTDTINPYFGPSVSRFEVKWADPNFGNTFQNGYVHIDFKHKFDTDSMVDGCSVEFSHDGGLSFINVLNNPFGNVQHFPLTSGEPLLDDSLPNGKRGLSGNSGGWIQTSIMLNPCVFTPWDTDTLIIHFVFRANSTNQNNREGWLIDDINFDLSYCESVPEYNLSSTLYPNPAINTAIIDFENNSNASYQLQVVDFTGRIVMEQAVIRANRIELNIENLARGMYQYRLVAEKEKRRSVGRFVVE